MFDSVSSEELVKSQEFLGELEVEVSRLETTMGGGQKLGVGTAAVKGLRETQVRFGDPRGDLIHLTDEHCTVLGIELAPAWRLQMANSDFYFMKLGTSLWPKPGVQFSRVECSLDLNPKGASDPPIAKSIFPQAQWRDVLKFGVDLNLALGAELEWHAGLDDMGILGQLPAGLKAKVHNRNELKGVVAANFSNKIVKQTIVAVGENDSKCQWRIDSPKLLHEVQRVEFLVVFQVPKATTKVDLEGLLVVEPSIKWLGTRLKDVWNALPVETREFLWPTGEKLESRPRLPVGDRETWMLDLPA